MSSIFETAAVLSFILSHILALFFGCLVLLRIIWTAIRHPGRVFGARRQYLTVPPCLSNPSYGEHTYIRTQSDLKFHYVAKGEPTKPLMLCLHGFPEFWYSWRHQLEGLSNQCRVVAVDMRGYGDSDKPAGRSKYAMARLTQDVRELISSLGYSSCILVCHDWGGFIGWTFAHEFPDLVERLIIMNSPHPMCAERYVFTHPSQLLRSWYVYFFQLPYLPEFWIGMNDYQVLEDLFRGEQLGVRKADSLTDEDMEAYKFTFSRAGALSPPLNYYRNLMAPFSRKIFDTKFCKPALVIWGTGDRALETKMLEGTEQYVPNLTIRYVEGASHWIQQEEPDIVNKYISDFLSYEMVSRPNQ